MDGVTASSLPVVPVLPRIVERLGAHRSLVLVAPPGAGKTTLVPLALLEAPWLAGQGILMLEPRRLAARAAAMRMADLLGEPVGERVGFRMRGESRVSSATRITVMTEGVLTRTLHADPELPGIGLLLFDEFHERTLQADLGMAFALDVQESLRDDLRILVMSATLEGERLSTFLKQAPLVCSEGRLYPVETVRLGRGREERLEDAVMRGVERALTETSGDLLVFLPGAAEIRRMAERLADRSSSSGGKLSVHPLFSALSREEQNAAILPGRDGRRKIVLATNIAESSLTIEGVTAVIDSGLERRCRYSPATGMSGLETMRIARTSAVQRCGRAGRLAPGRCYQLWETQDELLMPVRSRPEMAEADLTSLVLEVAGWGGHSPDELRWLDSPAGPRWDQAVLLLRRLGALLDDGRITPLGRKMLALPLHPRLSHMVAESLGLGLEALAWETAVLLEERDCLSSAAGPDLRLRFEALHAGEEGWPVFGLPQDRGALHQIRSALAALPGRGRVFPVALEQVGLLLSLAYPERIAMRRRAGVSSRERSGGAPYRSQSLCRGRLYRRRTDRRRGGERED